MLVPSLFLFAVTGFPGASAHADTLLTPGNHHISTNRQNAEAGDYVLSRAEWASMRELNPAVFHQELLDAQTGCLAIALYHEARGENEIGQIAVAQVILNRVKSRKYPDTICRVVFQNTHLNKLCQFSFACDGRTDQPRNQRSWRKVASLAKAIMCNAPCRLSVRRDPVLARLHQTFERVSHYHAIQVAPYWSRVLNRTGRIGRHIFYFSKRVWS